MCLQENITKEFGSNIAQRLYTKQATKCLWGSEKILIKRDFKPEGKTLDLGCGTGRTTPPLYKMKYKVIGIDITPEMIKNAKKVAKKKRLNIKYQIGDATKLKFKKNSFNNALFSFNGWTQIPEKKKRLKALKEVYRVLKPGGYFIFTAHKRRWGKFSLLWLKQGFRFYILKPLGFDIKETEFGDRFFQIEGREKQFIHIPTIREVSDQIVKSGFDLIFVEKSGNITQKKQSKHQPNLLCLQEAW